MTAEHPPVSVSPFQQKIKQACIGIETRFECRLARGPFAVRIALAAALVLGAGAAHLRGWTAAPWPVHLLLWTVLAAAAFWGILQIVRRFHDLGRTGGLFWALAVPFWALWKMIGLFPDLRLLWIVLCAWPIWTTLQLFVQPGTPGPNGYEGRTPPAA